MATKPWYAWATPSGPINLMKAEDMPVKPDHPCEQLPDRGCPICAGYELDLWAAKKENAVPIQDQERARLLIVKSNSKGWYHDTGIYGPFTVEYEIEFQWRPYSTQDWQSTNEHYWLTVGGSGNLCAEKRKIAILYDDTPEKERPDYINKEFKKVSESDLKAALREVNLKNKEIRDSYNDPDRLNFMVGGDWTEDFTHENGNYLNKCGDCGLFFKGHKRRVRCKKCSSSPEKEPQEDQETLLDELVTDIFEIGKEAILEKFTITRKQ